MVLVTVCVALALFIAGFYSAAETSAYRASLVQIRCLAAAGDPRAVRALSWLRNLNLFLTTTLIGHNLAMYLGTYVLTSYLQPASGGEGELLEAGLWATVFLAPAGFIFAETLPKRLACARPTAFILAIVRIISASRWAFLPLGCALARIGRWIQWTLERLGYSLEPLAGRARLAEHLEAGVAEGLLTETQHRMTQSILELEELAVRDIMIPLKRAFFLPENVSCREAATKIVAAGHTRAPLCDRVGQPLGKLVTVKDILQNPGNLDQPVSCLARETVSFDHRTSLGKALRRLKTEPTRLALITGKAGRPLGLITISDLLSRIVGTMKL